MVIGYGTLVTQPPHLPASMHIDPPLAPSEVDFLAGFSSRGGIRRVWPGLPPGRCPWLVSTDGRTLQLDADLARSNAADVAAWLRFLCHEFLAPSSIEAMHLALAHRLRGGHQLSGIVVVDGVHEIASEYNRICERVLLPEKDAIVLQFDGPRKAEAGPRGVRQVL